MQTLAFQDELQFAFFKRLDRIRVIFGRPVAAIPHLNRAAAVLALGDGPLEITIVERVILDFHR